MTKRRAAQLVVGFLVVPAILLGVSGTAEAAEVTPIAEYVDGTVSDTESEIAAALDAFGL